MPRLPRLYVPGGFYHVILRGNHRENIFSCADDRLALNGFVAEAIEKYRARIHAFCWMTNHLHAFIQISQEPLGKVVQRIAMRYSRYRHKTLRTTGHLFERRHRAFLVDADTYFLSLLRYLHFNPVDARIVASPDEYPWSSHRAYRGLETVPWLTTEFGLGLLSKTMEGGHSAYQRFINDVSSALVADDQKLLPSSDLRVIGTDRFLASLPPPRIKPRSFSSLEELAATVCNTLQLPLDRVRSTDRHRSLTPARVVIARRAVDERIASLHQVARYLQRSPSSLCQLLKRRNVD